MRRTLLTAALFAAACTPAPARMDQAPLPAFAQPASADDTAALVTHSNRFAVALYQEASREPGNAIISPISVSAAFGLLYPGARGATAAEIGAVTGFDAVAADTFPATMGSLLADLETHVASDPSRPAFDIDKPDTWNLPPDPSADFSIANSAWVDEDYALSPAYIAAIAKGMNAEIAPIAFSDPDAAAKRINTWVESKTNDRIRNLIPAQAIDPALTRLVLANAVWFEAHWLQPFNPEGTQDGEFYSASGAAMPARLMNQTLMARHFAGDGLAAIHLNYSNPDFVLSVILPDAPGGLPGAEAGLVPEGLLALLADLDAAAPQEVAVTLPKVRINGQFDLIPLLNALGIEDAFDSTLSDLSGLFDTPMKLHVSGAFHKTFFEMDEASTEAAAATGLVVNIESARPPPLVFRADHPFLLVLRHAPTGAILFLGRIETIPPA